MSDITCPNCDWSGSSLGHHWRYNEDHRITLSDYQKDVLTGLLMGDGSLNYSNKNSWLGVEMITEEYLNYLNSEVFPVVGRYVQLKHTAKEQAERTRKSGWRPNADKSDYHNMYYWRTMCHPELNKYNSWYQPEKCWPNNIELTPTVLKHWYVGDGNRSTRKGNGMITIGMSNEVGEREKTKTMFKNVGLPEPKFVEYESNTGHSVFNIRFYGESVNKLIKYMGEPLPGFEYKWRKN